MRRALLACVPLVAAAGLLALTTAESSVVTSARPGRALLGVQPAPVASPRHPARSAPPSAAVAVEPPSQAAAPDAPSETACARLEALLEVDDLPGLRDFVAEERSWARLEALRQLLERGGRDELPGLLALLHQDDAVLHALVGDACAAGGDAGLAERLAVELAALTAASARLAAAGAILAIDADPARGAVLPIAQHAAVEALKVLARGPAPLEAEAACDALAAGRPQAVSEPLGRLASDRGLDPEVRLAAIEGLGPSEDARQLLRELAADHPQHPAGRLARTVLTPH